MTATYTFNDEHGNETIALVRWGEYPDVYCHPDNANLSYNSEVLRLYPESLAEVYTSPLYEQIPVADLPALIRRKQQREISQKISMFD